MTEKTPITRESIVEAIYNRIFILDFKTSEKADFIKRFCKGLEWKELTPELIVHVVSYSERSHDIVIKDFRNGVYDS